jgi:excinuclease UvrABC helicase subunit UvrB
VERVSRIDAIRGTVLEEADSRVAVYPASHYVVTRRVLDEALVDIRKELDERLAELNAAGKLLEAQRLSQRTLFDLDMLQELGLLRHRELLAPPRRAARGAASLRSARLLPAGLPARHR